jgi:hypothetical protein
MPSLQANHSRRCAGGRAWTPFEHATVGCTCPEGPFYYVVVRNGEQAHKEAVGGTRTGEIALHRLTAAVADGSYRPKPTIGFDEWADRWLASLERKPSTVGSYRSTIAHAKEILGGERVRRLGPRTSHVLARSCASGLLALDASQAPPCLGCLPAGGDLLPLRRLQPGARAPAGAATPTRAKGGGLLRENDELPRLFAHLRVSPSGRCVWSR